jgi:CubicO group peptidase (beta-lactamase class C family)
VSRPTRQHRRDRVPVVILSMAGLLVAATVGLIAARHGSDDPPGSSRTTTSAASHPAQQASGGHRGRHLGVSLTATRGGADALPARLQAALDHGVQSADELGGHAAAAVWISGDARPLLSGPVDTSHRMWSMSKAVVSIAALQAVRDKPDSVMGSALADAIRRSDNCAIRRVIVGLQQRVSRGVVGTEAAFNGVLADAGAGIESTPQAAAAEEACVRYLEVHRGGLSGGDLGVVPQFGTAQWSVRDAIAFTHALGDGVYGASGVYLLGLMAEPKQPPLEEPPPPSAPALDWGAGAVFPRAWHPAWKAGWGGSQQRPAHFLAGQLVVLHLAQTPVAVVALFLPSLQPTNDNPGITAAPAALERIFTAVRSGLRLERVGRQ